MRTFENFRLVFRPKFCFGPTCYNEWTGLELSKPVKEAHWRLNCNSSSQINHGSGSRYWWTAVRHRTVQGRSLADSESRQARASQSQGQWPISQSGGVQSHLTASSTSHATWASGKSKLMSGPVTSWPELRAARDPTWTSDTSQKVLHVTNVLSSHYILCTIHAYHQRVHAIEHAGWYARGHCPRFESGHYAEFLFLFFSRTYWHVSVCTRFVSVHTVQRFVTVCTRFVSVHTGM